MKEAYLYKELNNNKVRCLNCAHYCEIPPNQKGICSVRKNINGKLYSLVYGKLAAINIDPIEKKPLFNFLPGSFSLSIATMGCNFRCLNCQNWQISQGPKLKDEIRGEEMTPDEIVEIALKSNLPSISYTYTEPTVFLEYALDTMKIAKQKGLKNIWVSNGYFSKETFNLVSPYLDAINIDLKGFSEKFYQKVCGAKLKPVLETLKRLKNKKIWTEVTTLVIPTFNDDEKTFKNIAEFIKNELGPETPWHISQFSGVISWQLQKIKDTPLETIEKAYQIGKKASLKYVYVGNVFGHKGENTYCPKCEKLIIERIGYSVKRYDKNRECPECGASLDIID
jgi:pyruvate formate lyase activating enzyme